MTCLGRNADRRNMIRVLLIGVFLLSRSVITQAQPLPYQAILDTLQLSDVVDIAFSPEYGLLIGDSRELMVWHISPDGRTDFIRAPGEGPGEYRGVRSVAWGPEGRIHIAGNSRMVVYSNQHVYESWLRAFTSWDIEVTDDGQVYASATMLSTGPIMQIDPVSDTRVVITHWRDSNEIMGVSNNHMASMARLQWNAEEGLLYIGYVADARFEVADDSGIINSFAIPSEVVDRSIAMMKREVPAGSMAFIQVMHGFCLTYDNNILASVGGEVIHVTKEGQIIQRCPSPSGMRRFYSGPGEYLFAVNRESMKIECIRLSDLFPNME